MTLYRIGAQSPLVDRLITAADRGKQVTVLVELKARFDERSNMEWATRLEEAGVHVVHGVQDLKTHCKICLVVRQEEDGMRRYVHVATGQLQPRDGAASIRIWASSPRTRAIVADVSELFNYLTGYSNQTDYRELLVGPIALRRRFAKLVAREITHARHGRPAHIILKVNAPDRSGGSSACCIARRRPASRSTSSSAASACCGPGVPGVSEKITVRSIVGRFLEHSRIWHFENGGKPEIYLGSADLMERNLEYPGRSRMPRRDAGIGEYICATWSSRRTCATTSGRRR